MCLFGCCFVGSSLSSVINDNELYFLGTARLMEEIAQCEQSGWLQLFYLCVLLSSLSLLLWIGC